MLLLSALALAMATPRRAAARVLVQAEEVLATLYPGATWTRRRAYLTEEQVAAVVERAGSEPSSALVGYYDVVDGAGRPLARAYLDRHVVRTKVETLLIAIDVATRRVQHVEVLAFDEPDDYRPGRRWYDEFRDRPLSDQLRVKGAIPHVAGATITAAKTTAAARRILVIDALLHPSPPAAEQVGP